MSDPSAISFQDSKDPTSTPTRAGAGPTRAPLTPGPQRAARHRNNPGAIAGGVVGGVILLVLLLAGLLLLWRWIRARRTAPSAEFMHVVHRGGFSGFGGEGSTPFMRAMRLDESTTPSETTGRLSPLPYHRSLEGHEPMSPFMPGTSRYCDRDSEEAHSVTEVVHEQYHRPHASYASSLRSDDHGDSKRTHSDGHSSAEEKPESAFGLAL
ncbi:hypothetical protein PYCCODRAFT_501225 [Trametes coccinea BRFM310]|uniref:Uncharacterized protein n=1 Tax=Trametes coccinea (strain BRFM310) TaxID=1353009 RepID=A0A1Y2IKK0_TRAC3|nr:hypothetical protein PYCCODRAFT_501225 [Trametes coccinea BRFM310]